MSKIVVCQHRLLHYRLQLFESLRAACNHAGLAFHLVHGQPTHREQRKNDVGELEWATVVRNRYIEVGGRDILWQPFPAEHRDADLVVLMQESRLLSNYPWLWWRGGTQARIAYWGHGRNFQSASPTGVRERWKKSQVGMVDWWFAYTDMTRDILLRDGYPDERITVLNNAIDNAGFKRDLASVSQAELARMREEIGAGEGSAVGIFCGSLYPDKRLDFLIAAADLIHKKMPDFRLVIIGDGPSAAEICHAGATRSWLKWLGIRRGRDKAVWFRAADIVLNPGLVGLHVLDAFCAGLPMITTADANHSPEIAYLVAGRNGMIVNGGVQAYADAVTTLLGDQVELCRLGGGALGDSEIYTLDNMVGRFVDGFERCVRTPRKR